MTETVFASVVCSLLVAVLPAVWSVCDRRATVSRLLPVPREPRTGPARYVDGSAFLQQVSRAVRAGATAAQAVTAAAPSSAAVEDAQALLRSGAPLSRALRSGDPELRTLAACIHHGTLSVHAVEHARTVMEQERAVHAAVRAGRAMARRSALLLTSLPFVLLGLGTALSGSVRSVLFTPPGIAVVAAGALLNRAGLAWMSTSARRITEAHSRSERPLRIASAVAAHLRAGGTLVTAFSHLAEWDADCALVSANLSRGEPLDVAVRPLVGTAPALAEVLVSGSADGLPLAPAVDSVVQGMIAERAATADEQTAELPVRGTAPLVLLVLPSFVLLAVAPIALAALRGLSTPRL